MICKLVGFTHWNVSWSMLTWSYFAYNSKNMGQCGSDTLMMTTFYEIFLSEKYNGIYNQSWLSKHNSKLSPLLLHWSWYVLFCDVIFTARQWIQEIDVTKSISNLDTWRKGRQSMSANWMRWVPHKKLQAPGP